MRWIVTCCAILLPLSDHSLRAETFHVRPDGSDSNSGKSDNPFATLVRAQTEARKFARREAVTIVIHDGTYYLDSPLLFTSEDSGSEKYPVLYQAASGESPVLSGGQRLPLTWEPFQNGIFKARVPSDLKTEEIFVNGQRQVLARYPNFDSKAQYFNGYAEDAFSKTRSERWADPRGGYCHAMHPGLWGGFTWIITGKDQKGEIVKEGGWQNNRGGAVHQKIRFVENIFEELDAPGEWFLDQKSHVLYFYPPNDIDLSQTKVEATRLTNLIEFRGTIRNPVQHVKLQGLTFRHANRTVMETKEPLLRSDWAIFRGGAIFFNGAEDCSIEDAFIDQVGGNAVFVNNYNRRVAIRGCEISRSGASGVVFLGDYQAARNPLFNYGQTQDLDKIDRTAGPKSENYPADCIVDDCLIYLTGRVEKQTAGVNIDLAQGITVRHCSIYDMPRSGINIGDGCWGGHVIEYCDIFDTVKETGDHGSFNSWGRDRFWKSDHRKWESAIKQEPSLPFLDAVKTTVLRNSRWRCDHGWDIDLDDGTSNYEIYNNLLLAGGLKFREGYGRKAYNNVMVNNGFHPHVWYDDSNSELYSNILMSPHADIGMPAGWGKKIDRNFFLDESQRLKHVSAGADSNSLAGDPQFLDPARGDFRVKDTSPALKLGFVNFDMDRFGVQKPALRAIARTPEISKIRVSSGTSSPKGSTHFGSSVVWLCQVRNIEGDGDRSAYGLPDAAGVLLLNVPQGSQEAIVGLTQNDVIVAVNDKPIRNVQELKQNVDSFRGKPCAVTIIRNQTRMSVQLSDSVRVESEWSDTKAFRSMPLLDKSQVASAKVSSGGAPTNNDPLEILLDGELANGYGPVFANGVENGMIKIDLGNVQKIAQVQTFTTGQMRARQRFMLYGSTSDVDPGWDVGNAQQFKPIAGVDTRGHGPSPFGTTRISRFDGEPLGSFRWLVWAVSPITEEHLENTSLQELQVTLSK